MNSAWLDLAAMFVFAAGPPPAAPPDPHEACDIAGEGEPELVRLLECSAAALTAEDPATALVLLDRAERQDIGNETAPASERVSLDMLRALALAETGGPAEAVALAEAAAARRPYALGIQRAAAILRSELRSGAEAPLGMWRNLVRIDPASRELVVTAEMRAGNWAGVVALDEGDGPQFAPPPSVVQLLGHAPGTGLAGWAAGYTRTLQQAYGHAALGHTEYARDLVQQARSSLAAYTLAAAGDPARLALIAMIEGAVVTPIGAHVEARIALASGDPVPARNLVAAAPITGPIGDDLVRAIGNTGTPSLTPVAFRPGDAAERPRFGALAADVLLPAGPASAIPADVIVATLPDGETEFALRAKADHAAKVQELTLLAAARTSAAAGKAHFVITARQDYAVMASARSSGEGGDDPVYRTVLRIAYPAYADDEPAAIATADVIETLGPVYAGE